MPQDDLGATLDELQSLVAGVGVGNAALPKPCVAGSNPAGGTTRMGPGWPSDATPLWSLFWSLCWSRSCLWRSGVTVALWAAWRAVVMVCPVRVMRQVAVLVCLL